ncbi:hypothetical protein [Planctomyces sp. SH-PL14]|uniref:hypothetical protein n=1 Tax=Planctomyces sp. SH-PL14 TaxID=1632864 RepID=UPI00078CAD1F|nr:hypothetical protein [Planctomyces sp. SH-PL14]AMV18823.1 hypothetical protein VT03_13115 [Planctomyces sp. SH-PL14]
MKFVPPFGELLVVTCLFFSVVVADAVLNLMGSIVAYDFTWAEAISFIQHPPVESLFNEEELRKPILLADTPLPLR